MWADYLSKPRNTSTSLFGPGIEEGGCVPCLPLLNFGLQGTPTGETMVSRYGQQSRCKLGLRVSTPQLLQSILCQFLQILERSAFGEFRVRHGRLPRLSGWKSGSLTVEDLSGVGSTLYADRRPPFRPCRNLTTTLTAIRATRPAEPSGAVTSVRTTVDRKRSSGPLDEELASEFGVHLSSRESENPQVSRRNRSSAYESRN
ncbi:MAG: hypothetical protein DMG57_20960 [Acidobacteria bacterium]|nr:MAG: hypothetical protein DMG57_20960 [Acidobacteriota bacterium]